MKEKQRPYCWETPDILQAAQPGHLSTSVGQTAQNQAEQTLGLRVRIQGGSKAERHHLPLSEIDEPLGLARGRQVSPVSVEQQLPLLLFSESARQLSSSAGGSPVSQAAGTLVIANR